MGSTYFSFFVGGICGLIAGGFVEGISRFAFKRRISPVIVAAFVLVAGAIAGRQAQVLRFRSELKAEIDNDRILTMLTKRHPGVREQFGNFVQEKVDVGWSLHQAASVFGQTELAKYIQEAAAKASDEAIVKYTRTYFSIIEDTSRQNDGRCYLFLFGTQEEKSSIGAKFADRLVDGLEPLLQSADEVRAPASAEIHGSDMNQAFRSRLTSKYGEARAARLLLAVVNAASPQVDREDVCLAIRELWQMALAMPPPDDARFARSFFQPPAPTNSQ